MKLRDKVPFVLKEKESPRVTKAKELGKSAVNIAKTGLKGGLIGASAAAVNGVVAGATGSALGALAATGIGGAIAATTAGTIAISSAPLIAGFSAACIAGNIISEVVKK